MSIRVDQDVMAALSALAEAEDRSLSWFANRALREWVAQHAAEVEAAQRKLGYQKSKP